MYSPDFLGLGGLRLQDYKNKTHDYRLNIGLGPIPDENLDSGCL